jgi:hypothetical protein
MGEGDANAGLISLGACTFGTVVSVSIARPQKRQGRYEVRFVVWTDVCNAGTREIRPSPQMPVTGH